MHFSAVAPHLWAWFEDSSGKRFVPGYGGSCGCGGPKTVRERMSKEAVLLKPGEHLDGTFLLDTKLFGGLKPGVYRVEAALTGWVVGALCGRIAVAGQRGQQ